MMLRIAAAIALIATPALATPESAAVRSALATEQGGDEEGALAILRTACDADDASACRVLFAEVATKNSDEAKVEARTMASDLCDKGDMIACVILSRYADFGRGGEKDEALKRESLITACRGGIPSACNDAARMVEKGVGGDEDLDLLRDLANRGCEDGNASACEYYGDKIYFDKLWHEDNETAWQEARALYAKSCELGQINACISLARMMSDGYGGEEDREGALELLEEQCAKVTFNCQIVINFSVL